ncbi:PREDICTED: uncharacterized protein LOC105151931 [Acromyrmex echinatior]|uniref:uncharacterized protein LOC105151931 n=1 Tax=Acromyrmex echinatior TaxID=103372 RepID=UPI000580D189|nr:PREDICTED: uncharacterized protein LOC105151931 [Acromyrmex echinatior]
MYLYLRDFVDAEVTTDEVLMLKGSLSPYLDTHNEEESSYVTLSNGPYGKYYNTIVYIISSVTSVIDYCIRLIHSLIRYFLVTAYVADSTSTEHNSYNHVLVDVYFVTPILCKHCEDYIWGTGKVGVKCKGRCLSARCVCDSDRSERNTTRRILGQTARSKFTTQRLKMVPLFIDFKDDFNQLFATRRSGVVLYRPRSKADTCTKP